MDEKETTQPVEEAMQTERNGTSHTALRNLDTTTIMGIRQAYQDGKTWNVICETFKVRLDQVAKATADLPRRAPGSGRRVIPPNSRPTVPASAFKSHSQLARDVRKAYREGVSQEEIHEKHNVAWGYLKLALANMPEAVRKLHRGKSGRKPKTETTTQDFKVKITPPKPKNATDVDAAMALLVEALNSEYGVGITNITIAVHETGELELTLKRTITETIKR